MTGVKRRNFIDSIDRPPLLKKGRASSLLDSFKRGEVLL
jgi:hypothetical protein